MPTVQANEDPQLKALEERLTRTFAETVSPQEVHESVRRAYDSFANAHIRSYIPLLVAKAATGELRTASRARITA